MIGILLIILVFCDKWFSLQNFEFIVASFEL